MGYQVYVLPDGKLADKEHVQTYPDATAAKPDMEHLAKQLPPADTIHTQWGIVAPDAKKFDFRRFREAPNVPGAGVDAESAGALGAGPRPNGPVTI